MDELDEIISEDKNSKDFNSDGFEIELEENQESAETVDKKDIAKEDVKEIIEEETELSNELDEEVIETHNDEISPELESIVKNDYQEETIVNINIPEGKSIGIASDHRGYKLKQKLTKYLTNKGYTVVDLGTDGSFSVDYPEFGFKLGEAVADYEVQKGIAICGSGIGISIACNKIKGVRCAKVDNVKEVKYARKDNDANVIAIAGNMPLFRAKDIVDAYLKTPFTGLDRHKRRIEMLDNRG
ncbi:MAG: RpiB/LacA/LacB family sugar-phosphate isomerase [Bacilli bacterium]|nr:RpiB/LacA/LacB family sugar-phosphate isomerase [Bacilli bacterium]